MSLRPAPLLAAALALGLGGCASPSPRMMSAEKTVAEVGGSRFTIYRSGDVVEIYRTSPEALPRLSEVMAKAAVAVEQATGCKVAAGSLVGDAALMKAELACG